MLTSPWNVPATSSAASRVAHLALIFLLSAAACIRSLRGPTAVDHIRCSGWTSKTADGVLAYRGLTVDDGIPHMSLVYGPTRDGSFYRTYSATITAEGHFALAASIRVDQG